MDPCECDLRAGPLSPKLQRDRSSRVCRAHSCDQQTRVDRALYMCRILTSCCSTDSERPHQCCHLPNNLVSSALAGYSLYSQWAGKFPRNWAFLWEYGPQLATWFHDYTISPLCKWKLSIGSTGLAQLRIVNVIEWLTAKHTNNAQRPRYVCSSRPHLCTACMPCGVTCFNFHIVECNHCWKIGGDLSGVDFSFPSSISFSPSALPQFQPSPFLLLFPLP